MQRCAIKLKDRLMFSRKEVEAASKEATNKEAADALQSSAGKGHKRNKIIDKRVYICLLIKYYINYV